MVLSCIASNIRQSFQNNKELVLAGLDSYQRHYLPWNRVCGYVPIALFSSIFPSTRENNNHQEVNPHDR